MLKKDEVKDDFPYMNLNDLDQVEKLRNYLFLSCGWKIVKYIVNNIFIFYL